MMVTIDQALVEQMIQTNIAFNNVMAQILSTLQEEQWVSPSEASTETGIPVQRIRFLARSGKIKSRKKSQKLIEVLLSDVKKDASNRA